MIAEIVCVIFVSSAYFAWRYLSWRFSRLWGIPGPIKDFTIKNWAVGVFMDVESEPFMQPQLRWWREAEKDSETKYETRLLHYTQIFGKHFILVLDPDGVKQILTSRSAGERPLFEKGLPIIKKLVGNGLITLEGMEWYRHRRIIQPAFHVSNLKESLSFIVPDLVNRFIGAWKNKDGSDIDAAVHFSCLTLDILGRVAFGHKFDCVSDVENWARHDCQLQLKDPLGIQKGFAPSPMKMLLINLHLTYLERYLIPDSYKNQQEVDKVVESVVEQAHSRYKGRCSSTTKPKCLLELLFDAKETDLDSGSPKSRSLTHYELQQEVKTFLFAGHETTASLCAFATHCLATNPEVQVRLYDEIMNHAPSSGDFTLESVDKLPYLEAFLNEVLRLYPSAGMILRKTTTWVNLLGEKLPPGTRITIPVYILHRHPKYWTDPECFKPERWLGERDPKFHHFAYFPFSAGTRNCIGKRLALWEAKLSLVPIIRAFEITLPPAREGEVDGIELVNFITMKSVPPIMIRAKPRL